MKLTRAERATLLEYLMVKGKPPWADSQPKLLAAICQESEEWAKAAYEEAYHCGYMEKIDETKGA